jgi:hypothetical protein
VAVGAVPFFLGVFEIVPSLRRGIIAPRLAWIGLGFGALWVAQFHLSAVLLVVIGAAATVLALRRDGWPLTARGLMWSAAGAVLAGATVVPTLASEGLGAFAQPGANVVFAPEHLTRLPEIAAQVLSFGSFEIARFIGSSTTDRLQFLARYWWAAPVILLAAVTGVVQVVVLFVAFFRRSSGRADWPAVRGTMLALIALVYASFMFSVKSPASHAFYFTMPAVVIYAFYAWAPFLSERRWQVVAALILVAGAVTHVAVAHRNFQDRSLYRDRARVVRAIERRDYRLVGERRSELWQGESTGVPASGQ